MLYPGHGFFCESVQKGVWANKARRQNVPLQASGWRIVRSRWDRELDEKQGIYDTLLACRVSLLMAQSAKFTDIGQAKGQFVNSNREKT